MTDPSKCFDDPNALAFSPWYPFMNTTARPDTANSTPERIWLESESCFLLFRNAASANVAPAQAQNLALLLQPETNLHPCQQLAETIGAAVLAGEVSLLAAQASHRLASIRHRHGLI